MKRLLPFGWVRQEDAMGCGVACLAMVTHQSYEQVQADLDADPIVTGTGERQWRQYGVSTPIIDRYLTERGWFMQRRYRSWVREGEPWPPKPFAPVHIAHVLTESGVSHFVVLWGDFVMDPAQQAGLSKSELAAYRDILHVTGLLRPG